MSPAPVRLEERPIHLGLGAGAVPQPPFTGMDWYAAYGERHAGDGAEGRLVSLHSFAAPWATWEMHPHGEEVVVCLAGVLTLIQEREGAEHALVLRAGEYAINARGVWHTADVAGGDDGGATALFITAGLGTEVRPR